MPTYPSSPTLTVDAMLRRPTLIARSLTSLTSRRFVADYIFAAGSPDQVAGGAAWYQRSESIYPDRAAEEVGLRSQFPRTGWQEAILSAVVKKYGLEVPIAFEAIRRNQLDQLARAERKLANAVTKFVDSAAMTLLTTDASIQTMSAAAAWTQASTTEIADIANARLLVENQDEGYAIDTMVVNPAQEFGLLVNDTVRNAMPRETQNGPIMTGRIPSLMGIGQILVTPTLTAGTVLFLNAKIVGTIADEQPLPGEGYVSFNPNTDSGNAVNGGDGISITSSTTPWTANNGGLNSQFSAGANFKPIYVKVYNEDDVDDRIVRGARWPAMWLAEPKAVVKMTGA